MDSCEGTCPIARSGTVRAKTSIMVDVNNEPAGQGLPDGWLKECRPRKNRYGSRMKGDMFYIDPINGYEFRSLKDVYRYLESGDISQCVMLPNKRKIEDLHTAGAQSHHTGRPSGYTQLDTSNESNQYNLPTVGGIKPESGETAENTPSSKPDGMNPIQREADRVESSEGKSMKSASTEHTPGEAESVTRKGATVEQKPKEKKHKTKPVKQIAAPLRSSPRLAALKIRHEANNAPKDGPLSIQTDITNQLQPKQVKNPRRKANSSVLPENKDGAPTLSSSEKIGDNYLSVPNQIQGASVPYSSAYVGCQNALAGAPILPQVGLGETADGIHGSALSSLFRHVWSDPCLQFAFRTLTGDIPVLNDTLAVANYFLPPQNLNKGATPSCSSSAYDGTRNHAQVDHVGLSTPGLSDKHYGNRWFPH
uniref:MBD domain-containing protein n=1 Tax=Arundo donax TaxID=35708 RepID=A0A0A9GH17_ARUDO